MQLGEQNSHSRPPWASHAARTDQSAFATKVSISAALAPPCPSRHTSGRNPQPRKSGPSCVSGVAWGHVARRFCSRHMLAGEPACTCHPAATMQGARWRPSLLPAAATTPTHTPTHSRVGRVPALSAHRCGPQTQPAHGRGLHGAASSKAGSRSSRGCMWRTSRLQKQAAGKASSCLGALDNPVTPPASSPSQYANVHCAYAVLSSNPTSMRFRPSSAGSGWDIEIRNQGRGYKHCTHSPASAVEPAVTHPSQARTNPRLTCLLYDRKGHNSRPTSTSTMQNQDSRPSFCKKYLMYGPGRPLSALKHRHVSSTITAISRVGGAGGTGQAGRDEVGRLTRVQVAARCHTGNSLAASALHSLQPGRGAPAAPKCCAARRHFSAAISSGSPCSSNRRHGS